MTATGSDTERDIPGAIVATPHSHGAPTVAVTTGSPAERFTSSDPADFAVPTGREEDWRFTPIRKLRTLFQPFEDAGSLHASWEAPDGATVSEVGRDDPSFGTVVQPADRVSALALAEVRSVLKVTVAAESTPSEPVRLQFKGAPGLNYGHVIVEARHHSVATVILDHTGSATLAGNVEISVGDGAQLTVVTVQDWDADAIHLAAQTARLGRDAKLTHISVDLGGSVVRINPSVRFDGPGSAVELYGLSFTGAGQHHEARLYVDHSVPQCTSNVVYKNVLEGDNAHTVWIGDVRIRPEALATSTYELNRNLLLTDGARADSVPNLEIETGEIAGAGHASATGRFDDLQLFYLQARGIDADTARRLVVRGFFADVVDHIRYQPLHDRLMSSIDARLGADIEALIAAAADASDSAELEPSQS